MPLCSYHCPWEQHRQCAIDPMAITRSYFEMNQMLTQDVILRAVLGNNRLVSSSPTSAPAGVSVWCCWPSFTKTSQCAKMTCYSWFWMPRRLCLCLVLFWLDWTAEAHRTSVNLRLDLSLISHFLDRTCMNCVFEFAYPNFIVWTFVLQWTVTKLFLGFVLQLTAHLPS